ncbi:MAG: hypothetical protein KME32_26280 [Mojavia pulchra JT2-VF2]|jgi:predicted dienelactone hydrolase|uniref:Platelet-activating factor acetylhydrolase n=1 Tax=Mojavia pulchra JT2-VF2 TaxID=287848 RepID=A0A951UIG0_9NOST|nr:hypothetical protein [Mojavia pulchra JT2-VF2]
MNLAMVQMNMFQQTIKKTFCKKQLLSQPIIFLNQVFLAITIITLFIGSNSINTLANTHTNKFLKFEKISSNKQLTIKLPNLTGKYQVGTVTYEFTDFNRDEVITTNNLIDKRRLKAQIWYPAKVSPGKTPAPYMESEAVQFAAELVKNLPNVPPDIAKNFSHLISVIRTHAIPNAPLASQKFSYPVIFLSHQGSAGFPELHTTLGEELASHGYIVVNIFHTYDAAVTVFSDQTIYADPQILADLSSTDPNKFKRTVDLLVNIRAADVSFLLDELQKINTSDPKGILTGRLDLQKVGITGHSLGGQTSMLALSREQRLKAGIGMDGWQPEIILAQKLNQPFMLLHQPFPDSSNKEIDAIWRKLKNDGYDVSIKGSEHQDFADLPLLLKLFSQQIQGQLRIIDPAEANKIIKAYHLAFFDKYLKNDNYPPIDCLAYNYRKQVNYRAFIVKQTQAKVLGGFFSLFAIGMICRRKHKLTKIKL